MDERAAFVELLQDMVEQARVNGGQISQGEIREFFEELHLSEEQLNHVYEYLVANRIRVMGFVPAVGGQSEEQKEERKKDQKEAQKDVPGRAGEDAGGKRSKAGAGKRAAKETPDPDSAFLQMYLRDLGKTERLSEEEEGDLLLRLLLAAQEAGADEALWGAELLALRERFLESKLRYVVRRAREYAAGGEVLDELIQEGNIGLMMALGRLLSGDEGTFFPGEEAVAGVPVERQRAARLMRFLEEGIRQAMDQYLEEAFDDLSGAQALVAKVNFVSEAAKAMKEENGEEPTAAQLAAYMNVSEEELMDIINLSADNLKA